jgi:tRNA dimethylallyltransferase
MHLAQSLRLEIISVDSAQVYRGLDVGTAKPSPSDRARVPHHLIDLVDPAQPYSAARFVDDAQSAIEQAQSRGALPLLVGGTMLYAKALREGLARLPSADAAVRDRLTQHAEQHGWASLYQRLAQVDPPTARRLSPADRQRIQRALEVFELTGTPMSRLLQQQAKSGPRLRLIALLPEDRAQLHRRIEQRFDAMLSAGLLEEVKALRARTDLHANLPSMRSVGYRQAWDHLERSTDARSFRLAAIAASRRLAKRQMTWLRSIGADAVIDPLGPDADRQLGRILDRWWNHAGGPITSGP